MNNADLIQAFLVNQKGYLTSYNITNDCEDGLSITLNAYRATLKLNIQPSEMNIITEILEFNVEKGSK